MGKVIWPSAATDHLDQITAYIAQFDPIAARAIRDRLFGSGNSLTDFPGRGRPASGGTRELSSVPPYILRYEIENDTVTILSIRHGARSPD